MRHYTAAALLAVCLALTGCADSDTSRPSNSTTATAKKATPPSLTAAQQRRVCVHAWAKALEEHSNDYDPASGEGPNVDEPAECGQVSGESHLKMYLDGLKQRNAAARKPLDDCAADPACTSVPVAP